MAFNTKQNLNNEKFEQFSGDTLNLSGTTIVYGNLEYASSATSDLNAKSLVFRDYLITGDTTLFNKDLNATTSNIYAFKSNTTFKGQGQVILTNGSGSISGISTNFLNNTEPTGVSFWYGIWVKDSSNNWYRITLATIPTNTTATISGVHSRNLIRTGSYNLSGNANIPTASPTYTGVSGTYDYYLGFANWSDGRFSIAMGNGSYAENYSIAMGGSSVALGGSSFATGYQAFANGSSSFAIGQQTRATNTGAVALGYRSEATGQYSTALGLNTLASGQGAIAGGRGFDAAGSSSDKKIIASGQGSINLSENNTSQTAGHGARAQDSAIIGGLNHDIPSNSTRSVIIGGNTIKASSAVTDTVFMPKVRIGLGTGGSLTTDDNITNVVVRDGTTGELKIRTAASLISGGTGSPYLDVIEITGSSFTLDDTHSDKILFTDKAGNTTVTIPTGLTVGFNVLLTQRGSGVINLDVNDIIYSGATGTTGLLSSLAIIKYEEPEVIIITSSSSSSTPTGSTNITTNNGLTKIGDNIVLGGTLTGTTTIDASGNDFEIIQTNNISLTGSYVSTNSFGFSIIHDDISNAGGYSSIIASTTATSTGELKLESGTISGEIGLLTLRAYDNNSSAGGISIDSSRILFPQTIQDININLSNANGTGTFLINTVDDTDSNIFSNLSIDPFTATMYWTDASKSGEIYINDTSTKIQANGSGGTTVIELGYNGTINAGSTDPSFSGMTYNDDYSGNYSPRSLVDKEYVDNAVNGVSGGSFTLTNGNATTASGTSVNLGGTTTGDININGASTFGGAGNKINIGVTGAGNGFKEINFNTSSGGAISLNETNWSIDSSTRPLLIQSSAAAISIANAGSNNITISSTGGGNLDMNTSVGNGSILIKPGTGSLRVYNPAGTFYYSIARGAIAANRTLTIPTLTGNDVFVTEAFSQTLTNKTHTSPVINTQISGNITTGGNITTTNYLIGATATQTLTNKTLTNPKLNASSTIGYVWTATGTSGQGSWSVPSSTVTANNGITKSGNNIRLGGTLTGTTEITGDQIIRFGNSSSPIQEFNGNLSNATGSGVFSIYSTDDTDPNLSSNISVEFDNVIMFTTDGTKIAQFYVTDGISEIQTSNGIGGTTKITLDQIGTINAGSNVSGFGGIKYNANYAVNFTDRSLVDKEYVDNAVSGVSGGSGNVASDAIWDAAGDLAVGSGANTAVKLAKGSNNSIFRVNGSGVVEWTAPQTGYTVTNATTSRTFDADTVTLAELSDIVATLINDLKLGKLPTA